MSNPFLNGLIILVAIVGAAYTFRSVLILRPEIDWLESYQAQRTGRSLASTPAHPKLLAPLAKMLGERQGRLSMSAMAMRSVLDGIGARLSERSEEHTSELQSLMRISYAVF